MSELQQLVCGKIHTENILKEGFKGTSEMAIALKVNGKKYTFILQQQVNVIDYLPIYMTPILQIKIC